jgi:hypothetical protein
MAIQIRADLYLEQLVQQLVQLYDEQVFNLKYLKKQFVAVFLEIGDEQTHLVELLYKRIE